MRRHFFVTAIVASLLLPASALAADPAPAVTKPTAAAAPAATNPFKNLRQEDVLAYIEELMRWQKDATAIEATTATTREILLQDNLQQNALKVLRSGFKFAKLESKYAPADSAPANDDADAPQPELTPAQKMRQHADENDKQVLQLQQQIGTARGAAREQLTNRLKLALARQELYQSVLANMSATNSSNGFTGQLEKLELTVPELNEDSVKQANAKAAAASTAASAGAAAASTTAPAPRPVTSVFTLAGDMFTTLRQQRVLHNFADDTQHMETSSRALIKPLRSSLDDISATGTTQSVNDQVATFNRVGSVLIPLGDATFSITNSKATVNEWQNLLDQRLRATFRLFLIKLAVLAVTIAIPLVIGEAVRRAIKKYIRDPKRQRQANMARRIIVAVVILFILLFNFISDFSSFATFAGFMTAGLAVALQSVLLSLVAHFFFYGRYGVRSGDRVNVAGVTGDILQIGIVRFYMRELTRDDKTGKLEYTGKTVAFPNSILFQNAAFYKYVQD